MGSEYHAVSGPIAATGMFSSVNRPTRNGSFLRLLPYSQQPAKCKVVCHACNILGSAVTLSYSRISVFRWSVLLMSSGSNIAFTEVLAFTTTKISLLAKLQAVGPHILHFPQLLIR